jgi:iron complex outermembrane receptor protein
MNSTLKMMMLASAATVALGAPGLAAAQTAATAAPSGTQIETVVVTARKSAEDQLKVPVAVTAFSQKSLEVRGAVALSDIAQLTPGLVDQQTAYSGARADRSFQALIIRGMNPSAPGNPTVSTFINGTPISSPAMLSTLADIDHVEVLKGPQSAYFGRQTFAGAINVTTLSAPNHFSGNLNVGLGTRANYNIYGNVGGPLIADKLMVTVGGNYVAHDGSYKNAYNGGGTLGDQSTRSFHGAITAKPIDNLTIKYYGLYLQDRDGAPATGILLAAGGNGHAQGNCTVAGTPFFCGTLPSLLSSVSPAQNLTITPAMRTFLNGGNVGGVIPASDIVKDFGLHRDAMHHDLTVSYEVPNLGLTFTYLGGYNQDAYSEMSDLANLDPAANGNAPGYAGFPFIVEGTSRNISHEFRVQTSPTKPWRALLGVSYVDQHINALVGAPTSTLPKPADAESKTAGVFFSLAYDILPQLTVNFDGRYQTDEEDVYQLNGAPALATKAYDFLPRASIQYRFTPDTMAYFTYSQGVNPGESNASLSSAPAQTVAAIKALGFNTGLAVLPELVTNYELGFKARFLDGRATFSGDVYLDKWTQQIELDSVTFAINDPNNPYNVVGSQYYNPSLKSIYPLQFTDNAASSTYKGVEVEANLIPVEHVTINASAAYNDAKFDKYNCTACSPYVAINVAGKEVQYVSKFSANLGIQYGRPITMFNQSADWFVRMDYVYRDGVYIEADDVAKTPNVNVVNFRGGFNVGKFGFDAYVNNAFNNRSYPTGFQSFDFTTFAPAVMVGLPALITAGVDLKYHF